MQPHNRLPASLRYFKARLRALGKPIFWGPTAVLLLLVLFTWEYLAHPQWFKIVRDKNLEPNTTGSAPSLTAEDRAIGADIDSSPVLLKDLNPSTVSPESGFLGSESAPKVPDAPKAPATGMSLTPANTAPVGLSLPAPFGASQNYRLTSPIAAPGTSLGYTSEATNSMGMGTNPAGQIPISPISPLQSAMERSVPGSSLVNTPNTASGLQADPANTIGQSLPVQATPERIVLPSSPLQQQSVGVNPVPNMGTLPYSNPYITNPYSANPYNPYPAPSNYPAPAANAYTQFLTPQPAPNQSVPGVSATTGTAATSVPSFQQSPFPTPFQNQNVGNQAPQIIAPEPPPFTAPRPISGRYVGGGEINTFSNP